jgi:DNA-binding CsgD family transcriptional regulator
MCRGREAVIAVEAAVSVLEALGPSVELARAYATFANQRMLYADYDAATNLARRAQALATRFGATAVYSDALNTEAVGAAVRGLDWTGQMRRALDIALAGGHHHEAARAYFNLCGIHCDKREFAEAERYLVPALAFCDEHDIATYAICLRGEQSSMLEQTGRWDEAIARSTEVLIEAGPSPANRLCALIRLGTMRARRGEPRVWECLDEAAATADKAGEPQQQIAARLARAEALSIVIGLGAQPAARIIRQRLRGLGVRSIPAGPHRATRKRPFGLTRREHEVLDLICAEHTNAEIAAKLFISAKTVDHHVSAVLAKLGVPTRAAARRVARLRLAGAGE